jgi:hypothetical protein
MGAIVCAKVTLTGSVDCRRKPPAANVATNIQPDSCGASASSGTADTSEIMMTRRAPNRSAIGPPKNPPSPTATR